MARSGVRPGVRVAATFFGGIALMHVLVLAQGRGLVVLLVELTSAFALEANYTF